MNVARIQGTHFYRILVDAHQFTSINWQQRTVATNDGIRTGNALLRSGGLRAFVLSIALCLLQFSPAHAANMLENAIAATEPCKPLKAKINFITVGVDKLESLRVDVLKLDVTGNHAVAQARIFLACKTSDAATFPGNVSANIGLDAELDLSSCQLSRNEIAIKDVAGSFGGIVDAFREKISASLQASLRDAVTKLCH